MTEAPAARATPTVRVVRTARPVPLGAVLGIYRRGAGDPTSRRDDGGWWFAWRTPDGPVTLRLTTDPAGTNVTAAAWGSGADWMVDRVPGLSERAAHLRQHMVDERLRHRAYTRRTGDDMPDVRDWAWPFGDEGRTPTDELRGSAA